MHPPRLLLVPACAAALALITGGAAKAPAPPLGADWPNYGNDKAGTRFSPLEQIDRRSVAKLELAWSYSTGELDPEKKTTIECTPVVVEGVMYVTTIRTKVVALDAATGKERWSFDPEVGRGGRPVASGGVNRGVAYWADARPDGPRRVLLATADGRLLSLDAKSGRPAPEFAGGEVDLRRGERLERSRQPYGATSPPAVFEDFVIVGFSVSESQPGFPGDIRAFDVRTGRERWRFRTVPGPGEEGHDTWEGESWKDRSGVNAWGGFTLDARRGILYAGLGSPASDFYGGDRKGRNLFGNCTIAIDARTGKRLWHFQVVRHDLWDYDVPCPPVVVTVTQGGRRIEAVAQVTKTGHCWVLNRLTGRPLFPMEERPVAASSVAGEEAWPTQPFPVRPPPFARQYVGPDDLTDITPEARNEAMRMFALFRSGHIFTPPTSRGTIVCPGFHGGATWSGASADPSVGVLYVNSNNMPNVTTLQDGPPGGARFVTTGYNQFRTSDGYPAIKPPWGLLTAIDLNEGTFRWQAPLGEFPELRARGIPPTGTENFGGTIATAGGLVFIGGSMDEKLHAFDRETGKLLWEHALPAGGYATPCTYAVNGKQYVAIAAGGGGKLRTRPGDGFLAFALP